MALVLTPNPVDTHNPLCWGCSLSVLIPEMQTRPTPWPRLTPHLSEWTFPCTGTHFLISCFAMSLPTASASAQWGMIGLRRGISEATCVMGSFSCLDESSKTHGALCPQSLPSCCLEKKPHPHAITEKPSVFCSPRKALMDCGKVE